MDTSIGGVMGEFWFVEFVVLNVMFEIVLGALVLVFCVEVSWMVVFVDVVYYEFTVSLEVGLVVVVMVIVD